MTTFDLTRTAIQGGTVLVRETKETGGIKTYTARILSIKAGDVRATVPYKLDKAGHKRPRETVRRFVIEFEEI